MSSKDYKEEKTFLMYGDCVDRMKDLDDSSIDSIVTDPPYGLGFMGKKWDIGVPAVEVFEQCLRVLKPGGHLLAFGGSRTYHRLAVAVEDAGFEIRDQIMWVYGSGFPKSQNIGKAIDKAAGVEREVGPVDPSRAGRLVNQSGDYETDGGWSAGNRKVTIDPPATDAAKQWDGWGTALKPSHEPIVVARKPLAKGNTVAANVMEHGTGAINVDGCRVDSNKGRFPANLIHDGSEEVTGLFPNSKSCNSPSKAKPESKYRPGQGNYQPQGKICPGDHGSAARFFYCAKASKKDRTEGGQVENKHPTVKPIDLMCYLVRLVTPPGGTVLDPFMGSGSTGKAAIKEGFSFIGVEADEESFETSKQRIELANPLGL